MSSLAVSHVALFGGRFTRTCRARGRKHSTMKKTAKVIAPDAIKVCGKPTHPAIAPPRAGPVLMPP